MTPSQDGRRSHQYRRRLLRTLGAAGAAATTISLAGCSSSPSDGETDTNPGDGTTVEMTDELAFDPGTVSVSPDTTVTWKNAGSVGHSVTAYEDDLPDGATYFASGGFDTESAANDGYPGTRNVPADESYEHTFETPGTYEYYCIPHEATGMVGTVEVVE